MSRRTIDEDEMRRILGSGRPLLDAPPREESTIEKRESEPLANPSEMATDARRKRIALPDFEATFLKPCDIRNRSALYVSGETKRKILDVVRMIGSDRMTATSYVENILRLHLELYKDEINRMYRERKIENLL